MWHFYLSLIAFVTAEDFQYAIGTRDICFPTFQTQKISPPDSNVAGYFGISGALSDDASILVIGNPSSAFPGGFYSYTRDPTTHQYLLDSMTLNSGTNASFDPALEGWNVALNGDGTTMVISQGFINDRFIIPIEGGVWVFIRGTNSSNGNITWTQQGEKFLGPLFDPVNFPTIAAGFSVSLSGTGDVLAYGAPLEENINGPFAGAVFIWTRNPTTQNWTFQTKLNGTNSSVFGFSLELSSDGLLLAVGSPDIWDWYTFSGGFGPSDVAQYHGGVTIYTRTDSNAKIWNPTGPRLQGISNLPVIRQGATLTLDNDGRTLVFGGTNNISDGVQTVFVWLSTTPNRTTWIQHQVIIITGTSDAAYFHTLGLSGDGNFLAIGGYNSNLAGDAGVAFYVRNLKSNLFSRIGCTNNRISGTGVLQQLSGQGEFSNVLSYNGQTMILPGPFDDGTAGASWVFEDLVKTNGSFTDCLSHSPEGGFGKSLYFTISCPLDLYWVSDQPHCTVASRVGPFPLVRDTCFQAQFSATVYASTYLNIHCTCPKSQYQNGQGACVSQAVTAFAVDGLLDVKEGGVSYFASNKNVFIHVTVPGGGSVPTGAVTVKRKNGNTWTQIALVQLVTADNGQVMINTNDSPNIYQGAISFQFFYQGDNSHAPTSANYTLFFYRFTTNGVYLIANSKAVVDQTVIYYGTNGKWTAENGFGSSITPFNGWTPNKNLAMACTTPFTVSRVDTPQVFTYVGVVTIDHITPQHQSAIKRIAIVQTTAVGTGKVLAVFCP